MFYGKTVWITGASSGFGEALALEFARQEARLVLSARREQALQQVREKIDQAVVVPMDMCDTASFPARTEAAIQAFGQIDLIVHNAGIAQNARVVDTLPQVHRQIMEVDFFGATELTRCLLPHFLARKSGHIVVVSGLLAKVGLPGRSSYCAAKAALHGYFDCLRAELCNESIDVSILVPGAMQTPLASKALDGQGGVSGRQSQGGCPVDEAARQALEAIRQKKYQSYIGKNDKGRLMFYMSRFFPEKAINMVLKQARAAQN